MNSGQTGAVNISVEVAHPIKDMPTLAGRSETTLLLAIPLAILLLITLFIFKRRRNTSKNPPAAGSDTPPRP